MNIHITAPWQSYAIRPGLAGRAMPALPVFCKSHLQSQEVIGANIRKVIGSKCQTRSFSGAREVFLQMTVFFKALILLVETRS